MKGFQIRRKSLAHLMRDAGDEHGPKLKQVLTAKDVFFHGVAAIIGAGIFVYLGAGAGLAGPGVVLSFAVCGIVCTLVGLAFAELASMISVSGSAYTYAYASIDERAAWAIGWDLLLEYSLGSAAVAVGWSAYLQHTLSGMGVSLPAHLAQAPTHLPWFDIAVTALLLVSGTAGVICSLSDKHKQSGALRGLVLFVGGVACLAGLKEAAMVATQLHSINLPAFLIIGFLSLCLYLGVHHTARMTEIFVWVKVAVIVVFLGCAVWFFKLENFTPLMPMGFWGVFGGAGVVFFAFIGFDAVTTLAEECKNPQTDMPRGVLGSLWVCTAIYMAVAAVGVGAVHYTNLVNAAPIASVLNAIGYNSIVPLLSVGALAGLTSVLIVLLFGQSRIMMRMSKDGLVSPVFGVIGEKRQTPHWAILIMGTVAALAAGFMDINELAHLTNVGTLAAFVIVCVGVIWLRKSEPNAVRKFRCPGMPWIPVLGAVSCLSLMFTLPHDSQIRFVIWMAVGFAIYYCYGYWNSKERPVKSK
jgi:APA family basic amino acid/polyamine antiporter